MPRQLDLAHIMGLCKSRLSIPSNPRQLLLPHHRRPRRQIEQRHLRLQRLIDNSGDEVRRNCCQVDHAATRSHVNDPKENKTG